MAHDDLVIKRLTEICKTLLSENYALVLVEDVATVKDVRTGISLPAKDYMRTHLNVERRKKLERIFGKQAEGDKKGSTDMTVVGFDNNV